MAMAEKKSPSQCMHEQFHVHANIIRLEDAGKYIAEIRVKCEQCDEPFRFLGVPAGLLNERPSCNVDGLELHAPIEPQGTPILHTKLRYEVPPKLPERS